MKRYIKSNTTSRFKDITFDIMNNTNNKRIYRYLANGNCNITVLDGKYYCFEYHYWDSKPNSVVDGLKREVEQMYPELEYVPQKILFAEFRQKI